MELRGVFMLKSIRHIFSLLEVELEDIKVEIEEFASGEIEALANRD